MATGSLFTLFDDIATLLDDVAIMTKLAAKKAAGVLGDDLALNAQQVAGIAAKREIPVIWTVAKGAFKNKLILVPAALLISVFIPWLITPLLMLGGLYLCYEGFEKVFHRWLHPKVELEHQHDVQLKAMINPKINMVQFEKQRIKGAIRTDFILSAEIIVITLGVTQDQSFMTQAIVVSMIAMLMVVFVYGLVAGIVKLDDLGSYLISKPGQLTTWAGQGILWLAPRLMRTISFLGTAAMFLVGGGIILHGVPVLYEMTHAIELWVLSLDILPGIMPALINVILNLIIGIVAGGLVVALLTGVKRILPAHLRTKLKLAQA